LRLHAEIERNMEEAVYLIRTNDGNIVYTNRSFDLMFGYDPGELIGKNVSIVNAPVDKRPETVANEIISTLAQTGTWNGDVLNIRKDGTTFWCHANVITFEHPRHGKVWLSMHNDITDRKQEEKVLYESQDLLNEMGKMAKVGGWELDAETFEVRWTEETYRIHELPLEYKPPLEEAINYFHPEEREKLSYAIQRALRFGEAYDMEIRFITAKGKLLWTRTICVPRVVDGKTVRLKGTFQDITDRKLAEEKLRESETELQAIFDTVGAGIIVIDKNTQVIIEANKTAIEMTGLSKERIVGQVCHSVVCPAQVGKCPVKDLGQSVDHSERKLIHADGHLKDILKTVHTVTIKGRDCYLESFIDISDRKLAEERLRESEERFHRLADATWEGIIVIQSEGIILDANESALKMSGFNTEEVIGKSVLEFLAPESIEAALQKLKESIDAVQLYLDAKGLRKDKTVFPVELLGRPIRYKNLDARVIAIRDVTERKLAEEKIKASLLEKETLLKEIHHRVKNNLQVISSLLSLQSSYVRDEESRKIFQESQDRVRAMAQIHTMLYQSDDLARIEFGGFIRDLASRLQQSHGSAGSPIPLHVDVADVSLTIETSIPCGLILNELVSNAFKHAFPEGRGGEVHIRMKAEGDQFILAVRDNGIGFPSSIDFRNPRSLGLELVNLLAEQINGTIDLMVDGGATFTVTFPAVSKGG
jgi:PAS domain S-box-containing protein